MRDVKSAAIYTRISKDAEGKGLGVERQRRLCEQLAAQKGWPVAEVYVDNDLSAYSGKARPAYERMLADLESGTHDAVLVVDQDRLTRHPMELESFINLADENKILLANVSGDVDLSTTDGRFRARIMGTVARQEVEKKSDRHRRQTDQAAREGWAHVGKRKYGYTYARSLEGHPTMEVVPHEAKVVEEVAKRFLEGETLRRIAIDLNSRSIATAANKQWRVNTLVTLLKGPHITGLRVHRGEVTGNGNWQPILDRSTWERIQARFAKAKSGGVRKTGRPAKHLLSGTLVCGRCGATMRYSQPKNRPGKYTCHPTVGTENCGRMSITAKPVEQVVGEAIIGILETFTPEVQVPEVDVEGTTSAIEEAELSLERLSVLHFVDGRLTEREYLAARDGLEQKITELRANLRNEPVRTTSMTLKNPRKAWDTLDTEGRRRALRPVVERIEVHPAATRGPKATEPLEVAKRLVIVKPNGEKARLLPKAT